MSDIEYCMTHQTSEHIHPGQNDDCDWVKLVPAEPPPKVWDEEAKEEYFAQPDADREVTHVVDIELSVKIELHLTPWGKAEVLAGLLGEALTGEMTQAVGEISLEGDYFDHYVVIATEAHQLRQPMMWDLNE